MTNLSKINLFKKSSKSQGNVHTVHKESCQGHCKLIFSNTVEWHNRYINLPSSYLISSTVYAVSITTALVENNVFNSVTHYTYFFFYWI